MTSKQAAYTEAMERWSYALNGQRYPMTEARLDRMLHDLREWYATGHLSFDHFCKSVDRYLRHWAEDGFRA